MKSPKRQARRVRNTRARIALEEWFASNEERSQTWLAARLRIQQPNISQWLRGTARPSPKLRRSLELICGIAQDDWLDADERADVRAFAKSA
jgi:ribosome-binding protein aMBF1 (putative translation factor)